MLTKSEEEIMYLLWDLDEPLTSSEIVKKAVRSEEHTSELQSP